MYAHIYTHIKYLICFVNELMTADFTFVLSLLKH